MGVGRASLREALKALEIMGLIEIRLGDGTYVLRSVSDVVERDDHGHWNFNAHDGSSGVVCLDGQLQRRWLV